MSVIFSFTKKHLAHYRKRSLIMAILYIFSTFFFVAEVLTVYNYYVSNQKLLDEIFGVHDGLFLCAENSLPNIEENDITSLGTLSVHALAVKDAAFSNRPIVLGTADAAAVELSKIGVLSGRMPQDKHEIALEQSYLNLFYPDTKIGDEIVMEITNPVLSESTYRFVLCGILRDFSSLQWNSEPTKKGMLNAVVSEELFPEAPLYSFLNIAFDGENEQLQALADRLMQEHKITAYQPNQRETYDLTALTGENTAVSFIVVMAVLFVLMIAALIAVSVIAKKGRGETIGLLKIAGFDVSGILKVYGTKALMLIVPSGLIGSLIAVILSWLMIAGGSFTAFRCNFITVFFCAAAIAVIAFLLFMAGVKKECKKPVMENRKPYTFCAQRANTISYNGKNPVFLYAVKSFLMNTGGNAASSAMIFFSIVTITVTSYYASGMLNNAQALAQGFDVGILSGNSSYISLVQVPLEPEKGIYKSDYTALKKNSDVDEFFGFQRLNVFRLTAEEVPKLYADEEKETFLKAKAMFGYPSDLNLDEQRLLGVEDEVLEKLNAYVIDGSIDLQALSTGEEIVVCCGEKNPAQVKAGDRIRIAQVINKNPEDMMISDYYLLDKSVKVGAVVQFSDTPSQNKLMQANLRGYVWSEKAFEQIGLHMNYSNIYINAVDKENMNSLSSLIGQLCMYYNGNVNVIDNLQQANAAKKFYHSFSVVTSIISFGLAAFSLISLMLAVSAKLTSQKKTFGFLRAVGLTPLKMFLIILTENALALGAAVILALLCSCGLCGMLYKGATGQFTAIFPVMEAVLLPVVYFVCIISICIFAIRRFCKQTIIDCIRGDE